MTYSQYQANANNAVAPSLWIQGATNWTQYAVVPQGSTVTLIAISPASGSGYLNEIYDGLISNFDQYFYPNSQLTFYADKTGQHTLYFMLNGQPSNQVTIDVTGTSNYVYPQNYLMPYNYPAFWYSAPTYYHSGHHIGHGNQGHHAGSHHK
ncbi:MAG: hypothetical protein ABR985_16175 [Methanotrichaceae archaeon]|jgi:hypothetical protein